METRWRAFPLHPDTPEDGLSIEELFAGRMVNIDEVRARLKREADKLGLPFGERIRTYNSRPAQELGKWAESKGKGEAFHDVVFRAYFVDNRNIGKQSVLIEIAKSLNLPTDEAREVLDRRIFMQAVDSDWARSRDLGITAVPTFVIDGNLLVGAQPYEKLERFLIANHVPKKDEAGR